MNEYTHIITEQDIMTMCKKIGIDILMDELIDSLEQVLKCYDDQKFKMRKREGYFYITPIYGLIEWMPILVPSEKMVTKIVGYHPANPFSQNISTIQAAIFSFDVRTGRLCMVCEGNFATALRTGASSAIASYYLAKTNSTTVGLVGCGTQAITQLHALSRKFQIEKVLIYDINKEVELSFVKRISIPSLKHLNILHARPEQISNESDIICTATSVPIGEGPVIKCENTQEHLHINAIGADFPGKFELPKQFLEKAFVCPDFLAQAKEEGECQFLKENQIGCTLDNIVKDPIAYVHHRQHRTVFDSTGFALEDYVIANIIEKYAKEFNLGQRLKLNTLASNPQSPYHFLI